MSLREQLQQKRGLATGLSVVFVGVAAWVVFGQVTRSDYQFDMSSAYYTNDDGKSYFKESKTKLPPFQSGGREAVKAVVFKCPSGTAVAFLERYTAETKKALEDFEKAKSSGQQPANLGLVYGSDISGKEVKKPGDTKWVNISNPAATTIMAAVCPDGSQPEAIVP